jgi:hypothetical protein
MIDAETKRLVRARASDMCEYCGLRQDHSPLASLQIEHVRPRKHQGSDDLDNLALACIDCNLAKGSNLTGFDPATQQITELFHPRKHVWSEHFQRQDALIIGLTPIGRTTVEVLRINSEEQIQLRSTLKLI